MERNRKAGQNTPRVVAPKEEEEEEEGGGGDEEEGKEEEEGFYGEKTEIETPGLRTPCH